MLFQNLSYGSKIPYDKIENPTMREYYMPSKVYAVECSIDCKGWGVLGYFTKEDAESFFELFSKNQPCVLCNEWDKWLYDEDRV